MFTLDVFRQGHHLSEASAATYRYVVDLEHRFIARKCPGMIFSPRSPAFRAFARSCASFVPEAKNGRLCLGDEKWREFGRSWWYHWLMVQWFIQVQYGSIMFIYLQDDLIPQKVEITKQDQTSMQRSCWFFWGHGTPLLWSKAVSAPTKHTRENRWDRVFQAQLCFSTTKLV